MRTFLVAALAATVALPSLAASKNKLEARARDLTDFFETVQKDSANAVPASILQKAEGLIIMRNYKAGFIIGVAGGDGIAIVKNKSTGQWGPIGFLKAGEGSFGFLAGGQREDLILVLMNSDGIKILTDPTLKLGVDVRATAGPHSVGEEANLKTQDVPVLVYRDTKGVYGGAAIQTGGVFPDPDDNQKYYGQKLTMEEILVQGKVQPTDAAKELAAKIQQYSKLAAR
jgi:lipid-binding SYLF domain-containing protein